MHRFRHHRYNKVGDPVLAGHKPTIQYIVEEAIASGIADIIIQLEVFDILAEQPLGAGGKIQLNDALRILTVRQPIHAYIFEGRRYDVGDRLGFLQATVEFAMKREDLKDSFRVLFNNCR